ncbi:MAG: enoyl-CoA hydratase/isomerase family protein, partial [Herminiimonas sp.]|nr:enoyl-CoA hydratase/isomerase family protein [Herminiimonas sp.]
MAEIRVTKDGFVATVTLSQPAKLNAINVAMWQALARTFDA